MDAMYDIKLHTLNQYSLKINKLVQFIIYQLYLNKVNEQCLLGEKRLKENRCYLKENKGIVSTFAKQFLNLESPS